MIPYFFHYLHCSISIQSLGYSFLLQTSDVLIVLILLAINPTISRLLFIHDINKFNDHPKLNIFNSIKASIAVTRMRLTFIKWGSQKLDTCLEWNLFFCGSAYNSYSISNSPPLVFIRECLDMGSSISWWPELIPSVFNLRLIFWHSSWGSMIYLLLEISKKASRSCLSIYSLNSLRFRWMLSFEYSLICLGTA